MPLARTRHSPVPEPPPAMDWLEIYLRLCFAARTSHDDPAAFAALEAKIRVWARARLGRHGGDVIEEVVADTCDDVVLSIDKARVPEAFGGFVRGYFLNACKR